MTNDQQIDRLREKKERKSERKAEKVNTAHDEGTWLLLQN